jgi:hypothetical protein
MPNGWDNRILFAPNDEGPRPRQDLAIRFEGSFDKLFTQSLVQELRSLEFVEDSRIIQGGPTSPSIAGIPIEILEKMWHIAVTFGPPIAVLTAKKAYEILVAEKVKAWLARNERERRPGTTETVTIYGFGGTPVAKVSKDKIEDLTSGKTEK